ncbi:MAG: EAL domain-containing protein [Thalassotalea sp.]
MRSLQTKIFVFFVLLLLLVQGISLWTIVAGNKLQEQQEITNRLTTAKTIFTEQFNSRKYYLAAFAETAAKDHGIKQVFEGDTRSLLVALNNHRKRIDADLAMTVSEQGIISAQLQVKKDNNGQKKVRQGSEKQQAFRFPQWLESPESAHLYLLENELYQLSLSPLTVGSKTIGWLAFGFKIDQKLADYFKQITQLETDFLLRVNGDWQLLASSNKQADLAFSLTVINELTPDNYIGIGHVVTDFDEHQLGLAMSGLKSDFTAVLQKRWWQFLLLAGVTLLLSLASAYVIAASIIKPVKHLVHQAKNIASGDYNQRVDIKDKSELGQLAEEFNNMQSAVLIRENAINHRANHDALTNLPNRNALNQKLNELASSGTPFIVCYLNLCRLQDVNETLGHDVGDWLIKEAAKRLYMVPQNLFLSHIGADEFVLLFSPEQHAEIEKIVADINYFLEQTCSYQNINLQLQTRIGVSIFPAHCGSAKSILQMADTALHHARKNNQPLQIYNKDLDVNSVERLNLINDLKHAIVDNQLELHYQPKLNLVTGVPTHVEALVRWQHPTLGMIPPDNFIYIAEQTGQINALTHWVFLTALQQYNQWLSEGIDLNIAVNISAENLKSDDFFDFICHSIAEHGVPTDRITLEVTESAVVDDTGVAMNLLRKFQQQGMKISIDDYGTGYSSLAQLKQLPVNELKIDKSFVQRLHDDEDDQIIVRSTIELAHNMGLTVVAEGIEDEFSLKWLAQHKCELGQGYFISRPQSVEKITAWLKTQKNYTF